MRARSCDAPAALTVALALLAIECRCIARAAGIDVFVTGGLGGVHRGAEQSFDISADLTELGRTRVAVVCAGVKSILDIGKTLEVLETQVRPLRACGTCPLAVGVTACLAVRVYPCWGTRPTCSRRSTPRRVSFRARAAWTRLRRLRLRSSRTRGCVVIVVCVVVAVVVVVVVLCACASVLRSSIATPHCECALCSSLSWVRVTAMVQLALPTGMVIAAPNPEEADGAVVETAIQVCVAAVVLVDRGLLLMGAVVLTCCR